MDNMRQLPLTCNRFRIVLDGALEDVAFRPFVCRLACSLALTGSVQNSSDGLVIEVEGHTHLIEQFIDRLAAEPSATLLMTRWQVDPVAPTGVAGFVVANQANVHQRVAC
jgi:hydrogenase maturation protein HypF